MYQINYNQPVHVHFIGIGGISMSGLAFILLSKGFTVSGSDNSQSPLTDELTAKGAKIYIGQSSDNISDGIDVVVYTAAIKETNPEFAECIRRNIPMLTRAQLLGQLMTNYKYPICVSGTHGKTTTSSLCSKILLDADSDPTLSIGGILKEIGGNIRVGGSDIFLTEACEYTNSFLSFNPGYSIILNIEEDHLDFFKDINDIRASFRKFALLLPEDGALLINGDIDNYSEITDGVKAKVYTFGLDSSYDYYAKDIAFDESGLPSFTFCSKSGETKVTLSLRGMHNIYNSVAALAMADIMKLPLDKAAQSIKDFNGADRRFEYKGSLGGVNIIDDYAHHPTEIKATLSSAKAYPHKSLYVVFQPHTYSRTKALFNDFAEVLATAENVILADIYAARENDTLGMSSALLCDEINKKGGNCKYFRTFSDIENYLLQTLVPDDLLITMGAGDVVKIGENLLGK